MARLSTDVGVVFRFGEEGSSNKTILLAICTINETLRDELIEISACASNRLYYVSNVPFKRSHVKKKKKRRKRRSSAQNSLSLYDDFSS